MYIHSSATDVRVLTGHSGAVYDVSFNNDNTLLLSSSEDGTSKFLNNTSFTKLIDVCSHSR